VRGHRTINCDRHVRHAPGIPGRVGQARPTPDRRIPGFGLSLILRIDSATLRFSFGGLQFPGSAGDIQHTLERGKDKTIMGYATCAFLGAALFTGAAHADIIFGLNAGPSGGGIFAIDTGTGTVTPYRTTPTVALTNDANGLGYDAANDTFYYVNRVGAVNRMVRNAATGEVDLGAMSSNGTLDSGTFYNGSYWTHGSNSVQVLRVNFSGMSFSELPWNVPGFPSGASFGDMASQPNGVTYLSFSNSLRRYDLDTPAAGSVLISMGLPTMQLAFGPSGLWGIRGTTIYSINTTTGGYAVSATISDPNLSFIDLATAPTPGVLGVALIGGCAVVRRRSAR